MNARSWLTFVRASIVEAHASALRDPPDMDRCREYGLQACRGLHDMIVEHLIVDRLV